ncbi:AI-2E family transporter [Cellulomonas iranensis]|uniref:AI-2E family transporter n=1 Tax=Cellulomonas iranensis TaxID=76862 RepID=UPI003D7DB87B
MSDLDATPLAPLWLRRLGAWSGRLLLVCAVLGVLLWVLVQLRLVVVALFLGLVLTAVLRPVTLRYRTFAHPALAAALAVLTGLVVVVAVVGLAVTGVARQWPDVVARVGAGVGELLDALRSGGLPVTVTDADLERWGAGVVSWLADNGTSLAGATATQVGGVLVALMVTALGVFCAVCFLVGGEGMWAWFVGQVPVRARDAWRTAGDAAWRAFGDFTRGAVLTALCVGVLGYLVLLVLGVPLALPLGVLVFVGSFVPLVGAPAAMLVAMLVALASNGLWNAVLVGVGIALVGQLEGHVVQPLVMGRHARLHPFVVGVGVSAGTVLGGLFGAVVAVPLIAVSWSVWTALRPAPRPEGLPGEVAVPGEPGPTADEPGSPEG